jgi:hypothetical protein
MSDEELHRGHRGGGTENTEKKKVKAAKSRSFDDRSQDAVVFARADE